MTPEKTRRRIIDVDSLQQQLAVTDVASFYGFALPEHFGATGEQRMVCPCGDCTGSDDDRSVSINAGDPFKKWKCHREGYGCGAQGNLITLAYCMKHGRMPPGGKPTGREFYDMAKDLERIAGGEAPETAPSTTIDATLRETATAARATVTNEPNKPLAESENENARKLVHLDRQLTVDLEAFSPAASAYARRRPLLLSEAFSAECGFGHMPGKSKSSLRGQFVFGIKNEEGKPLAWVGRNVKYEKEHEIWAATGRQGREPAKYRFPNQSLFRRGQELYGQEWLSDERFDESLDRYGLLVVEGFTDRIRLHAMNVMSVAIMSNQITDEQTDRLALYAEKHAGGRVGIMLDADTKGDEGAKELLWRLHEQNVDAYLVWTTKKPSQEFAERQPESLTNDEWQQIASIIERE